MTRPSRKRPTSTTLIAQREPLVPSNETPPIDLKTNEEKAQLAPTQPKHEQPTSKTKPSSTSTSRVKRSIQLDRELADQYDEQLFTLHAKHRTPKNHIHDAMLTIALKHLPEVEEIIRKTDFRNS